MHMSAVSSTTLSCRSVLRWPVLIEGNQEGVMLKAGFWRIIWMGRGSRLGPGQYQWMGFSLG